MVALYYADLLAKSTSPNEDIISYFCDHEIASSKDPDTIVSHLSHQLITTQPKLVGQIFGYFSPSGKKHDPYKCHVSILQILKTLLQRNERSVTCVLDGIDESDNTKEKTKNLLQLLRENALKVSTSGSRFKFLVFSQNGPEYLKRVLEVKEVPRVNLDTANTAKKLHNDVERFIFAKTSELSISGEKLQEISTHLQARAKETFLFVRYVPNIKDKTWTEVDELLNNLPKGLEDRMSLNEFFAGFRQMG